MHGMVSSLAMLLMAGCCTATDLPEEKFICLLQHSKFGGKFSLSLHKSKDQQPVTTTFPSLPTNDDGTHPLRLELTLPYSLEDIHRGPHGPLPQFIQLVQEELCTSVGMPADRMKFLSIRGEFLSMNASMLQKVNAKKLDVALFAASQKRLVAGQKNKYDPGLGSFVPADTFGEAAAEANTNIPHTVVVDIEILPGHLMSDPTPWMYFRLLLEQLNDQDSRLMIGSLGEFLSEATLIQGAKPKDKEQSGTSSRWNLWSSSVAALVLLLAMQNL